MDKTNLKIGDIFKAGNPGPFLNKIKCLNPLSGHSIEYNKEYRIDQTFTTANITTATLEEKH